jgi:phage baseplate assembly protein V
MTQQVRELHRRVMNMMARGVVAQSDDEPGMQRVQVSLLHEEQKVAVERFQNYGFSGHAPRQSEVVVVFMGGGRDHGVIVGTDDRNSRMTGLAEGEVAIYTDEGDSIVLRRDNTVEITTKHAIVSAEEDVTVEAKRIVATASETATIEAPDILLRGNVVIDGNLSMGTEGSEKNYTIRGNVNHIGDTIQTGNIHVDGNIDATGSITAPGGSVGGA